MFEWIREALTAIWDHLLPFAVLHPYQNAAVMRFGLYHRTIGPGFNWTWPIIEEAMFENIYKTTLALESQTVTTKDGEAVVVCGIVRYRIADVKTFICESGNQHDLLKDTSMGAVFNQVSAIDYDTLIKEPPKNKIASDIRRQMKDFGIEIDSFTFTDLGKMRTLRLITHTHSPAVL